MKRIVLLSLAAVVFLRCPVSAQTIDLTSGGGGTTTTVAQSFNETRAVDATVIATSNVHVTAMTLRHLWSGPDGMTLVGARIYDAATTALLCSHDTTVYGLANNDVTVPVSCTLVPGHTYRIGFFCGGTASDNSGLMYQPTFPYNDNHNLLQINGAKEYAGDLYPSNVNIDVPVVSLAYTQTTGLETGWISDRVSDLFPNPCTDVVTVRSGDAGLAEVSLYDVLSRKVVEQSFESSFVLATDGLPAGIYMYEVKRGMAVVKKGKLVKQ